MDSTKKINHQWLSASTARSFSQPHLGSRWKCQEIRQRHHSEDEESRLNFQLPSSSAAAAFFARASQRFDPRPPLTSACSRRSESSSRTSSTGLGRRSLPAPPPKLTRERNITVCNGKVRVALWVSGCEGERSLRLDRERMQVTLLGQARDGRHGGVPAPRMFAFDGVFTPQDDKAEVCWSLLADLLHGTMNGWDGCLLGYGCGAGISKSHSIMLNKMGDELGILPTAISWLFHTIKEKRRKTGSRFSVRASAVEVTGAATTDLLAAYTSEKGGDLPPSMYLSDGQLVCDGPLRSQAEPQAPSAEKATLYLDLALAARRFTDSHFLFSLHIYQYNVNRTGGVIGGRSRLHFLDLSGATGAGMLSTHSLGNLISAIFNSQKHLPHRENKVTQVVRSCLGGSSPCQVVLVAHVSPAAKDYEETLRTLQLASRIRRTRRCPRKFVRVIEVREPTSATAEIDPSSSEQSADTVIHVGDRIAQDRTTWRKGSPVGKVPSAPSSSPYQHHTSLRTTTLENTPGSDTPEREKMNGSGSFLIGTPPTGERRRELWIDGPRLITTEVEPTTDNGGNPPKERMETWVDWPGYSRAMDDQKKTMIQKWLDSQHHNQQPQPRPPTDTPKFIDDISALDKLKSMDNESKNEEEILVELVEYEEVLQVRDCCLQVTEEDIEICMAECENYQPNRCTNEIVQNDQEKDINDDDDDDDVNDDDDGTIEEHPLRALSQENLTVVSTFTDSSVANDIQQLLALYRQHSSVWPIPNSASNSFLRENIL